MKPIGTGLGHHVYYSAKNRPELGGISMGDHFEFLNGVNNGRHGISAEEGRKIVHAVSQEIIASIGSAVDGWEYKR